MLPMNFLSLFVYCHLIKRRPLTGWTGLFFFLFCLEWDLVILLLHGLDYCIQTSAAPFLSMVIPRDLSTLPEGYVRVAPSLPCFMYLPWRFWQLTYGLILPLLGIRLPRLTTPLPVLSLYADDTSIICSSDEAIRAVFSVYTRFESGTGAKLNFDKCKGLWLGVWRGRTHTPLSIQWTSDKIKVLGIFVGHDVEEANWKPRIEAVEKCLNSWRSRKLSYTGKSLVLNALALSRVWYVASVIPLPPWALAQLNTLVFSFFWSGKRDLVSRNVLVHAHDEGGFGVVSINLKCQALLGQWVRRLMFLL